MSNASRKGLRVTAAAVAAGALAVAGTTLAASWAAVAQAAPARQQAYNFVTLDNAKDPTFNQLLGINNHGTIAGYFGMGAPGHPNQGYLLYPPYGQGNYVDENFPGSMQTQVTGLNDNGITVGFWSSMNNATMVNDNHGFYRLSDGSFHTADFPATSPASPPVDQLLGVNDTDVAVGFWTDSASTNHGYEYNIKSDTYSPVTDPNAPTASLTAAAINNRGDVAGIYTNPANGTTDGFLKKGGQFIDLAVPGAVMTQALGVNDHDEVVGTYQTGTLEGARLHGFTWTQGGGFQTVEDPDVLPSSLPGINNGETTINGVNDEGDLVGFYFDGNTGFTHGFLATPVTHTVALNLNLTPMPQGTVSIANGIVTVNATGLTPGSAHVAGLLTNGQLTALGSLTADATGDVSAATFTTGSIPGGSRVVILDGAANTSVIAETNGAGAGQHSLHAVEAGFPEGSLQGRATIVYNPGAQTISVTVNATGLTPGAHAAHIHLGSCQSQGPVKDMLMDFTADSRGDIANQTRTVTRVSTVMLTGGWYLNLHQGNSNNILSNGQPTIFFRPLLCASI
ncbi:MAG TPA: CHRD domain-containing protein [Trebonia sp.]|nr:CHRD domain-containing protein [Trebonia sp.]